jgi:hypothetical protein
LINVTTSPAAAALDLIPRPTFVAIALAVARFSHDSGIGGDMAKV